MAKKKPLRSPKAIDVSKLTPIPMEAVLERGDRVTANLQLHHEQNGEQPMSVDIRYSHMLSEKVQAFYRRLKAPTEWQPIHYGWLETNQIGTIVIQNRAGENSLVLLNEDQKKEIAGMIAVIRFKGCEDERQWMNVHPGCFQLLSPTDPGMLEIRGLVENVPLNIWAIPK